MTRHKRRALQNVPDITFYGTNLDRVLNGEVTEPLKEEIRKDLRKAHDLLNEPQSEVPAEAYDRHTPFVPRLLDPLCVVMVETVCTCGSKAVTFGYFGRLKQLKTENGTCLSSHLTFVDKPLDKPEYVRCETRNVPFCHACIPTGLNKI